ncbi:MAG: peptidase M48, Ste24p [Alphaproteobacteria bacterium]|nr:MAG: peptidase M48, Ste24p [Alphaproteobacteria bacterium]
MTASLSLALKHSLRGVVMTCVAALFAIATAVDAAAQGLIRDAEIEETLRVYTNPLLVAAGLDPNDVDIYIVSDNSLNAFVSGGQNIFVHTGLIIAADNPNELMGVLAHETGHIAGGHLARSREAQRQAMGPALISIGLGVLAIAAGASQAGVSLISGSSAFAMGSYVRHTQVQESAADQAAVQYLTATGQSSQGLLDFFNENIRPYEFLARRAPPYMMTHPFTSDRVESLRERVSASEFANTPDTDDNLQRFAFMQAKLIGFLRTQGQTMARYPESDRSAPARYARAVAYYRVADLPNARRELDSLIAEEPRNPFYQELMGQILFENGRAEESIPYHERSLVERPNEALFQINLARALTAARGREGADRAAEILQAAVRIDPDNGFAWRELAQARSVQGNEPLAQLASAEQNFSIGNYPAALSFAERARRELPRNTTDYQRAVDLVTFAGNEVRDQQSEQRRR